MAMIQKCYKEGGISWPKSVNCALLSRKGFAKIDCEIYKGHEHHGDR